MIWVFFRRVIIHSMIIDDQATIFNGDPLRCLFSSKSDYLLSKGRQSAVAFQQDCSKVFGPLAGGLKHYLLMRTNYDDAAWQFDEFTILRSEQMVDGLSVQLDGDIWTNAIFTDMNGLALCLNTADCLPVTLYDPTHRFLALAHLGWQATIQHLLDRVVEGMTQEFASRPSDIKVFIGPSIKKESYIFTEPEQLRRPEWKNFLLPTPDGYCIDLVGYNLDRLQKSGIEATNIQVSAIDTASSENYESHFLHTKKGLPRARRFLNISMLL
jgi:hypothetical protein